MFDQLHTAYAQMQPGDKMVMQLHKSQKPPTPQYQTPTPAGGTMSAPPALGAGGAMGAPALPRSPDVMPGAGAAPLMAPPVAAPLDHPTGVPDRRAMLLQAMSNRFGV